MEKNEVELLFKNEKNTFLISLEKISSICEILKN